MNVLVTLNADTSTAMGGLDIVVTFPAQGVPGPAGGSVNYVHTQNSASAEWIVNHNLGFKPLVSVLTVGGVEVEAQMAHITVNQLRIYFAAATTGSVRCI